MDTILVVNAGSSSVKFQVFGVDTARKLTRRIKGQLDGIGTRPHLRASGSDGKPVVDRTYDAAGVSTVPAALETAGCATSSTSIWVRSATASCMVDHNTIVRF
jgi:acetate kinase